MLTSHLTSDYVAAANRLRGRRAAERVVVYTESYDDILFWNNVLAEVEETLLDTSGRRVRFEVMLPSRSTLTRGKKVALANRLGPNMLACVDADYDYLQQGATPTSQAVCSNPYVIHTYAYAIENLQCYAPTLQRVCVMATLNDADLFDFRAFMQRYSEIIYRLFVWNVWAYRYGRHSHFPLGHFADVVSIDDFNLDHPERTLEALRHRCNHCMSGLQRKFPEGRETYKPLMATLTDLGVTPSTTYLYMRGHDLFDHVVGPVIDAVCTRLRRQREAEINALACHDTQRQNEIAAYQHACAPWSDMLRKHAAFHRAPLYRQIVADVLALYAPAPTPSPSILSSSRGD